MESSVQNERKVTRPIEYVESKFDGVDMNPKRHDNELYCDYKCRMWWMDRIKKRYLQGYAIWKADMGPRRGSFKTQG
jgi:hypothetical protein